ncbi:MAG: aminoacyl-tRNA hydrolase [Gemmatimonadales bacterium]|nr:aminoacyl-tRNA hydrolase [Gemmatimonadales bacterium]
MGNPGDEYAETRHNAGFLLADHLVRRWGGGAWKKIDRAREVVVQRDGHEVVVTKPWTYMNRSGAALAPFLATPGWDPATHLLVLMDDVAIRSGTYRLRGAGSAGGHNGLKSVEGALRRQDYARLRIGIGPKPPEIDDLADYVLGEFSDDEVAQLRDIFDPMAAIVESWLAEGVESAMRRTDRP